MASGTRLLVLVLALLGLTTVTLGTPFLDDNLDQLKEVDDRINEIVDNAVVDTFDEHEDAGLSVIELIEKYGFHGEEHRLLTQDDYILELHRVTGPKNKPIAKNKPVVLIVHGLLGSSAVWVLNGREKSLAFNLADAGYDVWLGNCRGSKYSRKHVKMTVLDKEYWDFSWHEIGMYDLPAMIDYALEKSGQKKLFYIGHSQGTTTFFVMASMRPAYQDKIRAMFALAPVAYSSRMTNPAFRVLSLFVNNVERLAALIGKYEFEPTSECMKMFKTKMCAKEAITQPVCSNVLFLFGGYSPHQVNKTTLPNILGHVPAGSSTKQFLHYGQIIKSARFRQYDHGLIGNMKVYGKLKPPPYKLHLIKCPTFLHYSTNDWLAHVRDVHQTYGELGNAVAKFRVPDERFNHLDFMWGIDAKRFVYDKILSLMTRY